MGALDGSVAPGAIASSAVPQGIILVYDITDEKSFENIQNWMKSIKENASAGVERLLLGNKCDMEAKRKVRREQADKVRGAGGVPGPAGPRRAQPRASALFPTSFPPPHSWLASTESDFSRRAPNPA